MKATRIYRPLLVTVSILCLSASAFAGPSPRFMMVNGTMMELTPIKSDVMLKNGCKVCTKGVVIDANGKVTKVHEGEMISTVGTVMSPAALHTHGG